MSQAREGLARVGMGEEATPFASPGGWCTEMVTSCWVPGSQSWEMLQVLRENLARAKLWTRTFVS